MLMVDLFRRHCVTKQSILRIKLVLFDSDYIVIDLRQFMGRMLDGID
jgi:hypothetical protein